ncbi:MAG: hypothetical protein H6868_08060 [Rhodospirillales bacterium]|nr:hypothetical protein [Rhodospirillales bacterium]
MALLLKQQNKTTCLIRENTGIKTYNVYGWRDDVDIEQAKRISTLAHQGGLMKISNFFVQYTCPQCDHCVPCRIDAANFTPRRSQRRNINTNNDLTLTVLSPLKAKENIGEHIAIFLNFMKGRHPDEYKKIIESAKKENDPETFLFRYVTHQMGRVDIPDYTIEVRDRDNKLLGAGIYSLLEDGMSLNTYYYDVSQSHERSLGKFIILKSIEHAQKNGLSYIYLGPWDRSEDGRMHYKSEFNPFQILTNKGWKDVESVPQQSRTRPDEYMNRAMHKIKFQP